MLWHSRASGVIASLPVMKTSYWMVLSIAVCTAPVSTTMTTPGDSLVSVEMDSLRTAQTSVSGVYRGLTFLPTCRWKWVGPLSRQAEEFWNNLRHAGCRDLNECTEGGSKCMANTDCVNTFGAHICVCQIGFEGDPCETFDCCNFFIDRIYSDSGCTDIDECQYFRSGSANFTYLYPTFENLPGDEWSSKSYQPQACPPADACVNLFYKNELGFKCVPADQTYAAVIIGGHDWNKVSDVLKADLSRCDGAIPTFGSSNNYNHHRVTRIRHEDENCSSLPL